MTDFDINKLVQDQYNIQEKKLQVYNKILKKIYTKIEIVNKRKKSNIIYEVPNYIFGYPLYKPRDCLIFIISSLRKKGFFVKFNFPNILFISWDFILNNNIKNITSNLMKKNNQIIKLNNSQNILNKHFKKENKKIIDDLDKLIQNSNNNLNNEYDYEEDLKKLNDLSSFANNYN